MHKDVLRALETGMLAEIGLLAFVLAFGLILLYTFTRPHRFRQAAKQMPLNDDPLRVLADSDEPPTAYPNHHEPHPA
jgi:cbb3-type cytochrome oxidase subunit 3